MAEQEVRLLDARGVLARRDENHVAQRGQFAAAASGDAYDLAASRTCGGRGAQDVGAVAAGADGDEEVPGAHVRPNLAFEYFVGRVIVHQSGEV